MRKQRFVLFFDIVIHPILQNVPSKKIINAKFLQVVKETMRFVTVSPLVARETSQQVKIGGYVLPKVK